MARVLILALLVGLVWWLLFGRSRARVAQKDKSHGPVVVVSCAHCGVHLPRDDAVMDGGRAYCSQAHRLAGPSDHGSG